MFLLNALKGIEAWRVRTCEHCRAIIRRSDTNPLTKKGACKQWYILETKEKQCVQCKKITDCELDHRPGTQGGHHRLSDSHWWSAHGGVEAMKKERDKCDLRCATCHLTQNTHNKYKTKEGANRNKPRDQRRDFVNARKRQIGQCADCDALVVEGYEHLFSFAHKDAATKDPRGSISRLVHLGCSIETIKKEIELCLLKCATCHNKETKDRRKDWSKVASSPPSYPTVAPPFGNHGGVVSQRRREQNRLAQRRSREKQREKALEARRQLEERVMAEDEEEESRKRQLALAEGELEGVPEAGEAVARSPSTEEDA